MNTIDIFGVCLLTIIIVVCIGVSSDIAVKRLDSIEQKIDALMESQLIFEGAE